LSFPAACTVVAVVVVVVVAVVMAVVVGMLMRVVMVVIIAMFSVHIVPLLSVYHSRNKKCSTTLYRAIEKGQEKHGALHRVDVLNEKRQVFAAALKN